MSEKKSRGQEIADKRYPIVPLSIPETTPAGEILNDDKALDDFRISIQSFCSNHSFAQGYDEAIKDILREIRNRMCELWDKLPDSEKTLQGDITIEQAIVLGKYSAIESIENFLTENNKE